MEDEKIISMLLLNKHKHLINSLKLTRLSMLIGLGLILFLFESLIPRPLPWLKPGFAHVATLLALYMMGNATALIVIITRVLVGSLLLGSLFNPTFILALGGGVMATLAMILIKHQFSQTFSIFGISIIGATVHNLTQLILVELIIVHRIEVFYLSSFMMLSSIFTGFIVALVSYLIILKVPNAANLQLKHKDIPIAD